MSKAKKIRTLNLDIERLEKAKQSKLARHIDIANLLDAKEKLRALEQEASLSINHLKSK